ncbi:MAG TPA: catalase [Bacteroidales bacterium]|nr:catalase [Bacteroidales bacterium]
MRGIAPSQTEHDLVDSIDSGNYPRWTMKIQVMTELQVCRKDLIIQVLSLFLE